MVPGNVTGPWKSEGLDVIELLASESQIMGLVLAYGPRDSRMRAGAWRAMRSGVE